MNWAFYNLTTTTQSGGVETGVWRLAETFVGLGHRVCVIGGHGQAGPPGGIPGVAVRTFAYRPREKFPDLGSRARKLLERLSFARHAAPALRRGGFDRVMLFKTYDLAPAIWAMGGGDKVGYISGGTEYYPGFARMAAKLGYLACVSRHNAEQMCRATGLDPAVNYLGVDTGCFRPTGPDEALARELGLGPGNKVIVTAVRLVALKGVQRAMQAVAAMAPQRPGLRMLVAGDGPYRPELERLRAELGLEGTVHFVGMLPQSRLAGFYALGDVAVFPSIGEEALGLSAAEAMACGVPVVVSDLGGLPEVVGDAGLLVAQRDVPGLALAMGRLLDQPELHAELRQRGLDRVGRLFTWRSCAQRMIDGFAL